MSQHAYRDGQIDALLKLGYSLIDLAEVGMPLAGAALGGTAGYLYGPEEHRGAAAFGGALGGGVLGAGGAVTSYGLRHRNQGPLFPPQVIGTPKAVTVPPAAKEDFLDKLNITEILNNANEPLTEFPTNATWPGGRSAYGIPGSTPPSAHPLENIFNPAAKTRGNKAN